MNFKFIRKMSVLFLLAIIFVSCHNSRDYDKYSRATGWDLTGKKGGIKFQTDYKGQETGPGLVFIEGGTFTMGKVADDPMHDWNNTPVKMTVSSFYMDETEVTNRMYVEYLRWLKYTFPPRNPKYRQIYKGALPDTLVWRNPLGDFESMVTNYLRHPAFYDYPVVGVTWVQANQFSKWRTDRVNEKILEDNGVLAKDAHLNHDPGTQFNTEAYLTDPSTVYGGNDSLTRGGKNVDKYVEVFENDTVRNGYVKRSDGLLLPEYRLPTEAEWEYAAMGLSSKREYNNYRGRKKYPWDGRYTNSQKNRNAGDQLANFKQGFGDYSGVQGWTSDRGNITEEIKSFPPNDYGLYDMAGNVAEWVADVYRPRIDVKYNDMNYYRGNVYTVNKINKDGTTQIINEDDIQFDTLRNGRIVATGLPGSVAKEQISEEDAYLRTNYDRSDNRDFRNGDKESSRYYYEQGKLSGSRRMYNSPLDKVLSERDSLGRSGMDKEYDENNNRTTLISNTTRVVKGGSWKDHAYWLEPGQRRFYPQDMATNWIGFRNAMSHMGMNPSKKKYRSGPPRKRK